MRTAIIMGSVRQGRESVKPARYLERALTGYGHEVTFVDLAELNLPVFDESPGYEELPGAKRLVEAILAAEAVILVFPEYNHDVGAALRNALCYVRKREFLHRPVGLVAASNGQYGGMRALYAAKASFPTLGAVIVPTAVGVDLVQDAFPDDATCANAKISAQIETMITELTAYAPALARVRAELRK